MMSSRESFVPLAPFVPRLSSLSLVVALLGGALVGCSSDTTGPAPLTASQAYWALRLNYHAVNLSLTPPSNTMQLTATPLNAEGDTLVVSKAATFTVSDSTVSVDSTGLMHANYVTNSSSSVTHVIASLQLQNVTLTDTVAVRVTATPPATPLSTFTVATTSGVPMCNYNTGESVFLDNCGSLFVNAATADGTSLSNASEQDIVVAYATSNASIVTINSAGKIRSVDTGHVTLSASTWAYGVVMQDSLHFLVDWPLWQLMQAQQFTPKDSLTPILVLPYSVVSIAAGGTVGWLNGFTQKLDIVFDDPSNVGSGCFYLLICTPSTGSGNIAPFYTDPTGTDTSVQALGFGVRSFPVVGTYHFHSTIYPSVSGVIYVHEKLQ